MERAREPASLGTLPSDNGDVQENVDQRFQRTDRRPSSNRDSQVNLKFGHFTSRQGQQSNVQRSVTRAGFLFFSLNLLLVHVLVAVAVAVAVVFHKVPILAGKRDSRRHSTSLARMS